MPKREVEMRYFATHPPSRTTVSRWSATLTMMPFSGGVVSCA